MVGDFLLEVITNFNPHFSILLDKWLVKLNLIIFNFKEIEIMKKIFLPISLIFLSLSIFAQDKTAVQPYGYDILIGAKAGGNFNKVIGEEWLQTYNTNMMAGLFLALNGKRTGIQIEGLWSMNTVVSDTSFSGLYNQYFNAGVDSVATGKFTFHNFSIPVLLNYKLNQILWLQLGPQYTTRVEEIDKGGLIQQGRSVFRKGELSAVGGVWINVGKVGPIPKFNIGGRFITSISKINDLGDEAKWRNQRIQVHVGIGF